MPILEQLAPLRERLSNTVGDDNVTALYADFHTLLDNAPNEEFTPEVQTQIDQFSSDLTEVDYGIRVPSPDDPMVIDYVKARMADADPNLKNYGVPQDLYEVYAKSQSERGVVDRVTGFLKDAAGGVGSTLKGAANSDPTQNPVAVVGASTVEGLVGAYFGLEDLASGAKRNVGDFVNKVGADFDEARRIDYLNFQSDLDRRSNLSSAHGNRTFVGNVIDSAGSLLVPGQASTEERPASALNEELIAEAGGPRAPDLVPGVPGSPERQAFIDQLRSDPEAMRTFKEAVRGTERSPERLQFQSELRESALGLSAGQRFDAAVNPDLASVAGVVGEAALGGAGGSAFRSGRNAINKVPPAGKAKVRPVAAVDDVAEEAAEQAARVKADLDVLKAGAAVVDDVAEVAVKATPTTIRVVKDITEALATGGPTAGVARLATTAALSTGGLPGILASAAVTANSPTGRKILSAVNQQVVQRGVNTFGVAKDAASKAASKTVGSTAPLWVQEAKFSLGELAKDTASVAGDATKAAGSSLAVAAIPETLKSLRKGEVSDLAESVLQLQTREQFQELLPPDMVKRYDNADEDLRIAIGNLNALDNSSLVLLGPRQYDSYLPEAGSPVSFSNGSIIINMGHKSAVEELENLSEGAVESLFQAAEEPAAEDPDAISEPQASAVNPSGLGLGAPSDALGLLTAYRIPLVRLRSPAPSRIWFECWVVRVLGVGGARGGVLDLLRMKRKLKRRQVFC